MEGVMQQQQQERGQNDQERYRSTEKHPRCALLPSPELLAIDMANGSDETNTIDDFYNMLKWFIDAECLNTEYYKETLNKKSHSFTKEKYGSFIQLFFSIAFAAMRHTGNPQLDELVVCYYSGHGLPNNKLPNVFSMPELSKVKLDEKYNTIADQFLTVNPVVKGGELCLHHVGFCGLEGLLKPWIAAVKDKSQNAPGQKENKHLLIILDSCYSGILAKDLEELNKEKGPWNENGCTVTIQAACEPDEVTFGGYFTPCFEFFNQAANHKMLQALRNQWMEMDDATKEHFRDIQLPSPKLVTTRAVDETQTSEPIMVLEYQNLKLNLFKDPGFFKFCSIAKFKIGEDQLLQEKVLSQGSVITFMDSKIFNILDYKLKTLTTGPYAGTPMGLFLLEDPVNPKCAVCAHVHFEHNDTTKIGRINLVHHKVPPLGSIPYIEDHDGLSKSQVNENKHKIEYAMVPTQVNAKELVKACYDFVESKEPGRWADVSQWNMTSKQLGMMGLFKKKQRSGWMDRYLERYGYAYQKQE